jgi:hypothetical protein
MNDETKEDEHYWGIVHEQLLVVLRKKTHYEVCGAWECGIDLGPDIKIVAHIPRPSGHEHTELYYA